MHRAILACDGFLTSGDRTALALCIQHLDREAGVVKQERALESAGIAMSNEDLTKSVKAFHASIQDIEQRIGKINPYAASDQKLQTDDLEERVKDLEKQIDTQGTLLVAQSQEIEDLRKQVYEMRAELPTEPRGHAQTRAQQSATPSKAKQTIHPAQPSNNVKKATPPQSPSSQ